MASRISAAAASLGLALGLGASLARADTVGLLGEFWDVDSVANLAAAQSAIASRAADATFLATAIDYPRGAAASWSDGSRLDAFLAEDAASLSGGGSATLGGSVFRFSGFIALEEGPHLWSVGSDDGFSLRIGGQLASERRGQRAFGVTSVTRDLGAGWTPIELIYFENKGRAGVEFRLDGEIVAGGRIAPSAPAPIPLPATAALLIGGMSVLAWVAARRRALFD